MAREFCYWVGGEGSKSWNDTANWAATEGGTSGQTVPVSTDTVYINRGTSKIDTGLDQSAVNLAALHINFAGTIGTEATSLVLGSSAFINYNCGGTCYINPGTATIMYVYNTFDTVLYITGASSLGGSWIGRGTIIISGSTGGSGWVNVGGTIVVQSTGTWNSMDNTLGKIIFADGSVVTNCQGYSGTVSFSRTASVTTLGLRNCFCDWRSINTITSLLLSGQATISARSAVTPFTVTNTTIYGPQNRLFNDAVVNITYTNPVVYRVTTHA